MPCDEEYLKGMMLGARIGKALGMTDREIVKMWRKCAQAEIEKDKRRVK